VLLVARYLITSVSRGIGRWVATQLLSAGHDVFGLARSQEGAARAADLGLAGVWLADLADPTALAGRVGAALGALADTGGLSGLVHSAGIVRPGGLATSGLDDLTVQFTVNVAAVAELTRLALPALRAAGGTVVLVNSGSGLDVRPPLSAYGISKQALRAYADALRQEEPAIRVSSVYPGRTATEMQRTVRKAEGGEYQEKAYLDPATVAGVICTVLALPADGVLTDVTLRPAAHPGRAPLPDALPS
jgi:NAD(P)-dependent dehydrogenase (short-subunit alcohol dehydrogenase family)